jgi:hypothetical protein
MLEKQQQAVVAAMRYMTQEERAVLVTLAESYANERMNLKARFTFTNKGQAVRRKSAALERRPDNS